MRASWQGNCLWAVVLLVFSGWCHAQSASVTPEDEYKQLVKVNQDIQPLGAHPFGENISLYDGTLSFDVTDINVPGNGPTIQLGRKLTTWQSSAYTNPERPFGALSRIVWLTITRRSAERRASMGFSANA